MSNAAVALLAAGAVLVAVAIAVATYWLTRQDASSSQTEEVAEARSYSPADFKWPALIDVLYEGNVQSKVTTDEAIFILYYLKEMNDVFGDAEMKLFMDHECFISVYDPEVTARLQSVFWTKVLPGALWEVGGLLNDEKGLFEAMGTRYPIFAGMLKDLSQEVPKGSLDRLFILGKLPSILQARARQDALTLFVKYGCGNPVTKRVYSSMVSFTKTYGVKTP
jgi:hypothetical protein